MDDATDSTLPPRDQASSPSPAQVGAAYDRRAEEYLARYGTLEQTAPEDRARITEWAAELPEPSGLVLDAGCGPGLWSGLLHRAGHQVIGVDLSARFLDRARIASPGPEYRRGSFEDLPLPDGAVEAVLAWYSVIHTPPHRLVSVLQEFSRVLRPGGSLLLGFFHGEPGEPFPHGVTPAWFWTPEALAPMLHEAGLTVRDSRQRQDLGHRPHGDLSAVLQRSRPTG